LGLINWQYGLCLRAQAQECRREERNKKKKTGFDFTITKPELRLQ